MIYSKTCEYALRALSFLASKPKNTPAAIREVCEETKVPRAYVAKIFQCLVHAGILRSHRGPGGGFCFLAPPSKLSLMKVIRILDDPSKLSFSDCVMGLDQCLDSDPCPLHPVWKKAKEAMDQQLSKKTILDLVKLIGKFRSGKRSRSTLSKQMRRVFS